MSNWIRFNPSADETAREMGDSDVETFEGSGFDNSLTRQFDDEPGGGFYEIGPNTTDETESVAGIDIWGDSQENPLLVGPARTAYDVVFEYDQELNERADSADLPGSNLYRSLRGTVEFAEGQHDQQDIISVLVGVALLIGVLYLVRPLLTLLAGVTAE